MSDLRVGSEQVLLVEDERAVRLLVHAILENAGYRVVDAEDPIGVEMALGDRLAGMQLLVTDVVMPGRSGPALFAQLRAHNPRLRVLYMSGYTDDAALRNGRLDPGVSFLQKPFAVEELLRKIREVLDSSVPNVEA